MPQGKSIRIHLADGTVTGVRHAEVVNWTGQAIICPRTRVPELADWNEAIRPGVYILFGSDPESAQPLAYVGEAENVYDRLQQQVANKEFWVETVFFSNKDQNLTKAHVKYLESRFLELASAGKRYKLENGNIPVRPALPRGDRDSMEEFIGQARGLLGVLGHRILEPAPAATAAVQSQDHPSAIAAESHRENLVGVELFLHASNLSAKAVLADEGLVVRAGSQAAKDSTTKLQLGYRKLRENLLAQGILSDAGAVLTFSSDQLFSSPSQAAAVIVGYSINGRYHWRDANGVSLSTIEESSSDLETRS